MGTSLVVFLVILLAIVFYIVSIYNNLVSLRNRFQNAFAQIEVQLKRRYDLIPNLIETVKGYLSHERETLEAVVSARNEAANILKNIHESGGDIKQLNVAESQLSGALGKLSVVVESYPDLKANENMMQLTEELSSTENRIAFARQAYNDSVTAYNEYRQSFPPNFFAVSFGHLSDADLLEFADTEQIQEAPKVSF